MMKQNILIVDDHRENLIALEAILEAPGRNLVMCTSGNEALQLALKHDFALALLDVQMPDMDGFEVAELLRKNRKTKNIPIIFVTAISKENKYVFKGYECGAVDYLFKPLDQQILTAKVGVFLDLDLQRRKLQQAVVQMKRLKDENERLLQALGEGVLGTDEHGVITFANPAAATVLDMKREGLQGQPVDKLLFRNPEGQVCWSWADSPVLAACSNGERWHTQQPLYAFSGRRQISLNISASPLSTGDAPFNGCVLVIRDVTGREMSDSEKIAREQRRYPRKKMYRELTVFDRATGGNVGRLLNISVDGFKLFTRQRFDGGQKFQLSMVLPEQLNGVNTLSFEARAIWSQARPNEGEFHTGFQFIEPGDTVRQIVEALMENY